MGANRKPVKKRAKKRRQVAYRKAVDQEKADLAAVMGRPRKTLSRAAIKNIILLASRCMTEEDIATISGVSVETLKIHFSEPIKKGRAQMRENLLAYTFKNAEQGNVTAQIWLAKQDSVGLHFTDKLRTEHTGRQGGPIEYKRLDEAQLFGILKAAADEGRLSEEQKDRLGWSEHGPN